MTLNSYKLTIYKLWILLFLIQYVKNKLTFLKKFIYIFMEYYQFINVICILLIIYNFKIINWLFMTSLVQARSNRKTKNHSLSNILIYLVFKNMVQITEIMISTRSVHPTCKPGSSRLGITIIIPRWKMLIQIAPPTLLFYFILF